MSTSEERANRFNLWMPSEHGERGDFTMLVVLVEIVEPSITPVRSTFINVIGGDARWTEMVKLFDQSGAKWNAAAFFPLDILVPSEIARAALRDLEERIREDRRVLNEGHFFDAKGRRLEVEEVVKH